MPTIIVMGGQYGSEGKGALVAWLTAPARIGKCLVIRTGGPNAGHSMRWKGETYQMRQIPCAWHNPKATLALGPGAVVNPTVLAEEMQGLPNLEGRFWIDPMCAVLEEQDREGSLASQRATSGTREGVGEATARRLLRSGPIARDHPALVPYTKDVASLAREFLTTNGHVAIESTQGYGLSLTRSGLYPYTTSRDITPPAILNDAGVPLLGPQLIVMVLRTFPIRVAGNSGPMKEEITWDVLNEETAGYVQPERTTVTRKIRRVGRWDPDLAKQAVDACCPDVIALTFFDYWRPDLANQTTLDAEAYRKIEEVEKQLGVPVVWVSTGFQTITTIRNPRL